MQLGCWNVEKLERVSVSQLYIVSLLEWAMAGVGGQTYTNPDLEDQEIEEGDVISKQATVFLVSISY